LSMPTPIFPAPYSPFPNPHPQIADDLNMKKALFLTVLILIVLVGCTSSPKGTDIWSLLARGDSRVMDFFKGEFDVNERDHDGRTPLHYASEREDPQLASFFISLGANPNALDNAGRSPLGISVARSDVKTVEVLVNGKADIHLPLANNTTAARIALTKNGDILKAIIKPVSVETVDADGRTILHLASIEGKVQAVYNVLEILPSTGVSVDKYDRLQKKALDYALARPDSRNHIEIAEQLILSGATSDDPIYYYFAPAVRTANYNIRRGDGFAPIHYAVRDNYQGLIEFLFDKRININLKSTSGSTPLHEAARAGNVSLMKTLIERGADVNAIDAKGNSPLHIGIPAAVHNDAVTLLLEKGANPNLRDEYGDTPLHIVIILNRPLNLVQTLLSHGTDVHIRNIQGKTPLYIAVQEKRTDLIPVLLSYGSEVFASDNAGVTPFSLGLRNNGEIFDMLVTAETVNQRDSMGNTMLHAAVRNRGLPRHIGKILDQKAIVDARNRDGDTALHIAVRMNQRENGEFLISRGASIFAVNAASESPLYLALTSANGIRQWMLNSTTIIAKDGIGNNMLHYAAQWNLSNAIPVIIQKGVSVEEANATGETPIFMATKTNSPSTIKTLLDNNANLNVTDNQGNTLLHAAVRWNAANAAALLIGSGIDINAHTLNGETALHNAVILGMGDIETLLIKEGANLEERDIDGNTPFMEAVRAVALSSIEKLAKNGADTNTRNIRGDTPLHIAVATERYEVVNLLLRMGASIHARNTRNRTPFQNAIIISPRMVSALLTKERVNIPDDLGKSALHIALQEKASNEILRVIISQGARVNAIDYNGQTPLRLAVDLGLLESAKILADAGSDPFLAAVDNKSPSDIAFAKGETYIRALFSGRAINARDNSSNTILHHAARFGTPEMILTLLELGANKTLKNISAEVPMDIAVKWNRSDNAVLLRLN
jgi:ankyrin repeat protein